MPPHPAVRLPRGSKGWRRFGSVALGAGLAVVILGVTVFAGIASVSAEDRPLSSDRIGVATGEPSSGGPIVVAVALGQSGTDAADALAPYEVFARSPHFAVYTIAEERSPVPLNGGLELVPTYAFADTATGAARRPDVVVVPAVNDPAGEQEGALRSWVSEQSAAGTQILGVCAGSRVLAATGVLDGHRATSHWSRLDQLEQGYPGVDWVRGQRYVQDGDITTTAGVSSGIPGALRLVEQLAGRQEAERIGTAMAYPSWSPDAPTEIPVQSFEASDLGVGLNFALPWFRPTVGVALHDGVGELDAAAPFEVYSYSAAARTIPVATGSSITTAHGVVLMTTSEPTVPSRLDRIVVPGVGSVEELDPWTRLWVEAVGVPVSPLPVGSGLDAALDDLATQAGSRIAATTAKFIEYPAIPATARDAAPDLRTVALAGVAVLLAIAVGMAPTWGRRRQRRREQPEIESPHMDRLSTAILPAFRRSGDLLPVSALDSDTTRPNDPDVAGEIGLPSGTGRRPTSNTGALSRRSD